MHFPPLSVHRYANGYTVTPYKPCTSGNSSTHNHKNRGYPFRYHPLLTSYEQFNSEYRSGILYSYFYL